MSTISTAESHARRCHFCKHLQVDGNRSTCGKGIYHPALDKKWHEVALAWTFTSDARTTPEKVWSVYIEDCSEYQSKSSSFKLREGVRYYNHAPQRCFRCTSITWSLAQCAICNRLVCRSCRQKTAVKEEYSCSPSCLE